MFGNGERREGDSTMTVFQPYEHAWRARAAFVSSKLDRAHSSVYFLGEALENGETRFARGPWHSARRAVDSAAKEVKTLRDEQPLTEDFDEPAVTGAALRLLALLLRRWRSMSWSVPWSLSLRQRMTMQPTYSSEPAWTLHDCTKAAPPS